MKRNEVTPAEASKMLGIGRLYLYELLASGKIKGRKVLGRWLLSPLSVEAYRRGRVVQPSPRQRRVTTEQGQAHRSLRNREACGKHDGTR
jgi:excisionase family DNA binding protein